MPERPSRMPETAPPTPEVPRAPEQPAVETEPVPEANEPDETTPPPAPVARTVKQAAPASPKDEFTKEIEDILSEDLTDLFLKMNPAQQEAFKKRGEETAGKVRKLLGKAKVHAHAVLLLIRDWLKMIPGVNKFFLEQEAKIKTDKVLDAAEERRLKGTL